MSDDDLELLAYAAKDPYQCEACGWSRCDVHKKIFSDFQSAASPATVLRLIVERDNLKGLLRDAERVLTFCEASNPAPDLSFEKYRNACKWVEEKAKAILPRLRAELKLTKDTK